MLKQGALMSNAFHEPLVAERISCRKNSVWKSTRVQWQENWFAFQLAQTIFFAITASTTTLSWWHAWDPNLIGVGDEILGCHCSGMLYARIHVRSSAQRQANWRVSWLCVIVHCSSLFMTKHFPQVVGTGYQAVCTFGESYWKSRSVAWFKLLVRHNCIKMWWHVLSIEVMWWSWFIRCEAGALRRASYPADALKNQWWYDQKHQEQ